MGSCIGADSLASIVATANKDNRKRMLRKVRVSGDVGRADAALVRRSMRDWYRQGLGRGLLDLEQAELDGVLPNLFGYYLIQIGCLVNADLLGASRVRYRVVVDELPLSATETAGHAHGSCIRANAEYLPVQRDSVDVVLLPHTLEFAADPHGVLREVERVLVPEGHVVILGFNPWSMWGVRRLLTPRRARLAPPWCGEFRSQLRIKDWLALLGFDVVVSHRYFFRPPITHTGVMRRLEFAERVGRRWWPILGGAYMLVAKKRVATLTPIKPRWRPRRSLIRADAVKPTTFSSRKRA